MAITLTTLTGAVIVDQNVIAVASSTGVSAGCYAQIDQEVMQVASNYLTAQQGLNVPVLRGREGSATQAHVSGAQVRFFLGSDVTGLPPQQSAPVSISSPSRERTSITVAGALPFPKPGNDIDIVLNGTSVVAATLTNPTTDMDGCRMVVMGNGKAAHTVTYTTVGFGNVGTTADVITFSATQAQAMQFVACGGFWLLLGPSATATASVSGPSIA